MDSRTGEVVWRTAREARPSFGTPMLASFGGQEQLVVGGGSTLSGYDLATGEVIWTTDIGTGHVVSSVVVIEDVAYIGGGYSDHRLKAIQAFENNGIQPGTKLWETRDRVLGYCSPLVVDGHVFVITNTGTATCLDAVTGEVKWQEPLGGNYTASPIAANGNIYFSSMEGIVSVVEASSRFELVAVNDIGESIVASPAAVGDKLLIRTASHLLCFRNASTAGNSGSDGSS
ncbi:MAG: PQQ-like beta-propeller repeat protein [Holophagales bacterium]|nr:PQQ-like beta-propeller repeat protein [Holophagales bacterium]